jgi:hypothetical protein
VEVQVYAYTDTWDDQDPHANFKADVAQYTLVDPLPTLAGLSRATGVPVPCLIRYVLVKYAASNSDALLALGPLVLNQMQEHISAAEAAGTAEARLKAYESLRQMISWLQVGMQA